MKRLALAVLVLAGAACASEPPPASPALTEDAAAPVTSIVPDATVGSTAAPPVASSVAASASPTVPATVVPTTADPDAVIPEGFAQVQATVTTADGTVCELCLWLADTEEQRARGLMFVTDLGGADGMAFRYESPQTGAFWMKNTVLPLSIAFYAADGAYLGAFDMEPCTADPCPTYPTMPDFTVAIETTQGNLAAMGIEPGSVLALSDLPCVTD